MQVIIGLVVLSGTIIMLNFRYERQFSEHLEEEVSRQKEKLQKSEARYQGLVENAADLIYTVDDQGRILSINRFAADLFSRALADLPQSQATDARIGGNTRGVYWPDPLRHLYRKIRRASTWTGCGKCKATGKVRSMRHQVAIGGQEFWFSTSIVGIRDEQGQTSSPSRSFPATSPAASPSKTA